MSEVFISYVKEDRHFIEYLCGILRANGVRYWLDREQLAPGVRWRDAIEDAIRRGTYFLSVFSKAREGRDRTYANEELVVAIEELRQRPSSTSWFIPIKIDDCEIENRRLGGGERMLDINYCDLTDWRRGIEQLLRALGVASPILDPRKPLAAGLSSYADMMAGYVRYEDIEGAPPVFQGMEHRVVSGWMNRSPEGPILGFLELRAPFAAHQEVNKAIGCTGFHITTEAGEISRDPDRPTGFRYERDVVLPRGLAIPNLTDGTKIICPFDTSISTSFTASGHLDGSYLKGHFSATLRADTAIPGRLARQGGSFEILLVSGDLPPEIRRRV